MSGLRPAYVLPLRWDDDRGLDELTRYLRRLAAYADVVVVDGSSQRVFDRHHEAWHDLVQHVAPATDLGFANGKVNGVTTGIRLAGAEQVVIADDDVRYDAAGLAEVARLLDDADLVRPQNYFCPFPWHARWDTARSLLNRAVGADYPGTLGVRRSTFLAMGGYDGDVLFENLQLIRTVEAHGGVVHNAAGLFVRRRPPEVATFWSQRVRQAYDDFAQPARLLLALAVVPAVVSACTCRAYRCLAAGAITTVGLAEVGRRRAGGRTVFPASSSLLAPVWVLERGVCSWLAMWVRLRHGGVSYAGRRLTVAATSSRQLRREFGAGPAGRGPAVCAEARHLVGAVAERLLRRQPTPAEGDGGPTGVDRDPVLGDEPEVAADQQRPVRTGHDGRARGAPVRGAPSGCAS